VDWLINRERYRIVVQGFNNQRDSVDVPESGSIVLGLPDRGKPLKQEH
jgi:hypothetical protein